MQEPSDHFDTSHSSPAVDPVTILVSGWIVLCAGLVVNGWLFSQFVVLAYSSWTAVVFLFGLCWYYGRQLAACSEVARRDLGMFLRFKPFLLLGFGICVVILMYPPITHDSLSYRIPRVLIWLQEGQVLHVPVSDHRINYMTLNWELVVMPFFKLGGNAVLELPSLVSWLVLYLMFSFWDKDWTGELKRARWIALIAVSSVAVVLQASRTMNDLFAMASLFFIVRWEGSRNRLFIGLSGFALALAAIMLCFGIALGALDGLQP